MIDNCCHCPLESVENCFQTLVASSLQLIKELDTEIHNLNEYADIKPSTDKSIMMNMKYCANVRYCQKCPGPLYDDCYNHIARNALRIIQTRQKTIARLKKDRKEEC